MLNNIITNKNGQFIKTFQNYTFWLLWSIITGGMIISGPLLAPLAFTKMPVIVSHEISQYAHSYAETLFTLFFVQYFPIVALAFMLITVSEQFSIRQQWKRDRIVVILCEIMLLAGNIIWIWLALQIVPEMESMVMNIETWNDISVRESFSILHGKSQTLSEIGLVITMILPLLTRISAIGLAKGSN